MKEVQASFFAEGFATAAKDDNRESELVDLLINSFGLDEYDARWHASRAFHPEKKQKIAFRKLRSQRTSIKR